MASCIILKKKRHPCKAAFPLPAKKIRTRKHFSFLPLPLVKPPFLRLIPIKFLPLETFLSTREEKHTLSSNNVPI